MIRKPLRRKPKQDRAGATYTAVVEAAVHVLLDRGYAKTTTNRIAERAGVSVGSLYQYFDSKDAVFVAVIQNYMDDIVRAGQQIALPEGASIIRKLELIAKAGVGARPDGPRLVSLLNHTNSSEFRKILDDAKSEVAGFLQTLVRAKAPNIDNDKLELRLQFTMDAVEGLLLNATIKHQD